MLIGRRRERAVLDGLVEAAARGSGAALLVTGEPGIGKTTLLDDLAARRHGSARVLRTSGAEAELDIPFARLAELLRPAAHHLESLAPPRRRALRRALGLEDGGPVDELAVGVAALGLLEALAADAPVLVVVDDLQWVDEPTRAVIVLISRRLGGLRVALVCGGRDDELPEAETRELPRLVIGSLGTREASALLAASSRVPLDPAVRRRLLDAAEGSPLALAELPVGLSDAQLTGLEPLGDPIPVNGGIERVFRTRVARLPERTRLALLLVAATGPFDAGSSPTMALQAGGLDLSDLQPAQDARLASVTQDTVTFRHPMVRAVVYHGAPAPARRSVHAILAGVEPDEDRRAWHRAAAAVAPAEEVASELDAAAGRALARGAPASAARAFESAARLSARSEERGRRLAQAARAAHRAGDVAAALRHAGAARKLTADPIVIADLLLVESELRMRSGDLEGAHRALTEHAERIVELDPSRAATMLLLAAKLRIYRLEARAAVEEVERALEVIPTGEHDVLHLAALGMSRAVAGRGDARDTALAAAAAAARSPHGHAHVLGIAWPLIWVEEYDAAREVTEHALAVQRDGGFLLYLPQALLPRAELDFRTGHWESAVAAAGEALTLFEETRQPTEAAAAAAILSRMEGARGNASGCQALAQRALACDVEFGLRSSSAHALAALGLLALGSRRPEEAIAPLEAAERIAALGGVGEPWLLQSTPDLIEALARGGHRTRALKVLREFESRSDGLGRISASAAAARCAGILEGDAWQDAFERALALHDRVPTPFERARTELCYAERLRRARQRADARARLRSALEVFELLGATPWEERVRAELNASGETIRRRSTPVDTLTSQERAVAALVAGGATNREVGARLFVSAKTVEFHLGNIYRKLGLRSRTELARRMDVTRAS